MHRALIVPARRAIKIALLLLTPLLLSFSALPASSPTTAIACACCANSGDWYQRTSRMQEYELTELGNVKFNQTARLYLSEADDSSKGMAVDYLSFNLSGLINPRRSITLTFKGEKGETGSLVLSLSRAATFFGTDMHDMPEGSAGPILYKEWRFNGVATGSGFFRKGMSSGARYRLVLQGRGNNCLSAEDFKNWTLQVTGPRASFAFYGALGDSPEATP